MLPLTILYIKSRGYYFWLYVVFGYRKKVVLENLRNSFPEKSEKEIKEICRKFYLHFCDVIVEGIYGGSWGVTFEELMTEHPKDNYLFYFDISFDETVKRHAGRDKSAQFGEKEMRKWYGLANRLNHAKEILVPEHMSEEETIAFVEKTCQL